MAPRTDKPVSYCSSSARNVDECADERKNDRCVDDLWIANIMLTSNFRVL